MFVKSHELVRHLYFLGADSVSNRLRMSLFLVLFVKANA